MAQKYYGVRNGKETGVYENCDHAREQTVGYSGAEWKSFQTIDEAWEYAHGPVGVPDVTVYTDGSYTGQTAGWGVYAGPGSRINGSGRVGGPLDNNLAELFAVEMAVRRAKAEGYQSVDIHTDSETVINGMNRRLQTWEFKNEIKAIRRESQGMSVNFVHVTGHNGNYGNEEAHDLAHNAASN